MALSPSSRWSRVSGLKYVEQIKSPRMIKTHLHYFLLPESLSHGKGKDLPGAIKRIAEFSNRPLSEDDVVKIADHCRVESMKKNEMVNWKYMDDIMTVNDVTEGNFINKGATGGWYDVLTSEQSAKIDAMAKELENSGFDVHRLEEKQGVNI